MTERTINAGDWLEHEHYGRVRVAGFDEELDPVFAVDRGTQYQCDLMSYFLASTRPLPGCDSWDWVEPVEKFQPRYFVPVGLPPWGTTERYVYVSDPDGRIDCVYSDGRRKRQDIRVKKMAADALTWREIFEHDATAILTPPESLSTCPDCGEFRGHGHEDVCRRRDLPPVTATLRTRKPVRLFRGSHGFLYCGAYDQPNADTEVIIDGTTVYLQEPAQ